MENQFLDFPLTRDEKTFEHLLFIKIYIDLRNRVKVTSAATRVDQFRKDVLNIVAFHVFIKMFFFHSFSAPTNVPAYSECLTPKVYFGGIFLFIIT